MQRAMTLSNRKYRIPFIRSSRVTFFDVENIIALRTRVRFNRLFYNSFKMTCRYPLQAFRGRWYYLYHIIIMFVSLMLNLLTKTRQRLFLVGRNDYDIGLWRRFLREIERETRRVYILFLQTTRAQRLLLDQVVRSPLGRMYGIHILYYISGGKGTVYQGRAISMKNLIQKNSEFK